MPRLFAYGHFLPRIAALTPPGVKPLRARLGGWKGAFVAASRSEWGTRDNPAPLLALVPGGSCRGVVVELTEDGFREGLERWRELEGADRVVETVAEVGLPFRRDAETVTFLTVDARGPHALRPEPVEGLARRVVVARGRSGTGLDRLKDLVDGMREWGLDEPVVTALWKEVQKERGEAWR